MAARPSHPPTPQCPLMPSSAEPHHGNGVRLARCFVQVSGPPSPREHAVTGDQGSVLSDRKVRPLRGLTSGGGGWGYCPPTRANPSGQGAAGLNVSTHHCRTWTEASRTNPSAEPDASGLSLVICVGGGTLGISHGAAQVPRLRNVRGDGTERPQRPASVRASVRGGYSLFGPVVGNGPVQRDAVAELRVVAVLLVLARRLLAVLLQRGRQAALAQAPGALHQTHGLGEAWREEGRGRQRARQSPAAGHWGVAGPRAALRGRVGQGNCGLTP